jgi:cell division protein FtsA
LDIGTSKVVALVAELGVDGHFNVVGVGQTASKGLKKGVVVNIEATVQSIQKALEEAEVMADRQIVQVFTGIAGNHIVSFNSSGMVAIRDKEVSAGDVERVLETAKAINIPTDQQILHILVQEFIIDGQEDVREPIGMSGLRLEVKVHIVTGAVSAAQNIVKCVRRCGLEVWAHLFADCASLHSALRCINSVAFIRQNLVEKLSDSHLIVDHQNTCHTYAASFARFINKIDTCAPITSSPRMRFRTSILAP